MTEWNVVPEPTLRELAEQLTTLTWPLDASTAAALAEARGWSLMYSNEDAIRWTSSLPVNKAMASATVHDGIVSRLRVTVSDSLPEETRESTGFLRDVFVDQVAMLTEMFGEPTERQPGRFSSVRWVLANGSSLEATMVGTACGWTVTSPEFVQIEADLGRR